MNTRESQEVGGFPELWLRSLEPPYTEKFLQNDMCTQDKKNAKCQKTTSISILVNFSEDIYVRTHVCIKIYSEKYCMTRAL